MLRRALAALVLILALTGCGGDASAVIRMDIDQPVRNLDPQFATDPVARMILANIFEGLLTQQPDGSLHPGVAGEHSVSPDGLTYTFTLREDALWQDGTPVSAQDFVFAFQRIFSPYTPSPFAAEFLAISNAGQVMSGDTALAELGVRARGERTLVFTLEWPDPGFLARLATTPALPTARVAFEQSRGRYGLEARYVLSNGPFALGRWDASQIHLVRSEQFRQPPLPERVMLYVGRPDPLSQFLDGRSDLVFVSYQHLHEIDERRVRLFPTQRTVWGFAFNQNVPPWSNPLLRQSLALALDSTLHAETLPESLESTGVFVPPIMTVQGQSFRALAGESTPLPPDAEQSRRLMRRGLQLLGYERLPTTMIFVPESHEQYLAGLEEVWQRELGAQISIVPIGPEQLSQRVLYADYGVILLSFPLGGQGSESPGALLRAFYGSNNFGYNNPRFDHALTSAARAQTPQQAAHYYRLAESILTEDAAIIPVYFETSYYAIASGLFGLEIFPMGGQVLFHRAYKAG